MKIIFDKRCLEYQSLGHPESGERVALIYEELRKDKRFELVKPQAATEEDLLLVHSPDLIEAVRKNLFYDPDTPNIKNIYTYAMLAAGGAVLAGQLAGKEPAFSLSRPPGHHATRNRVGGFCYFNNIAVAVEKLLKMGRRVGILDIDVHHGNGTQEIFLGKKNVIFCSLHQIPLYPGTGQYSEQNCFNFPLSPGTEIEEYKKTLEKSIEKIKDFQAEILAVSLGFDTYKNERLANINLEIKDYQKIGEIIRGLKLPTFLVLEGGYAADIGKCAREFFEGLTKD